MIVLRNLVLVPQIIHNIRLGSNPGFNVYYIFGFIGSRLLIPLYERLCPDNRFHLSPNITLVVILFSLYALEVTLFLQRSYFYSYNLVWARGSSSPNGSSPTISITNRKYI
jgi:hypothetical protein